MKRCVDVEKTRVCQVSFKQHALLSAHPVQKAFEQDTYQQVSVYVKYAREVSKVLRNTNLFGDYYQNIVVLNTKVHVPGTLRTYVDVTELRVRIKSGMV